MHDRRQKAEPKDGAQRKREHDARQKKLGRRQFLYWLSDDENAHLQAELKRLRKI